MRSAIKQVEDVSQWAYSLVDSGGKKVRRVSYDGGRTWMPANRLMFWTVRRTVERRDSA